MRMTGVPASAAARNPPSRGAERKSCCRPPKLLRYAQAMRVAFTASKENAFRTCVDCPRVGNLMHQDLGRTSAFTLFRRHFPGDLCQPCRQSYDDSNELLQVRFLSHSTSKDSWQADASWAHHCDALPNSDGLTAARKHGWFLLLSNPFSAAAQVRSPATAEDSSPKSVPPQLILLTARRVLPRSGLHAH